MPACASHSEPRADALISLWGMLSALTWPFANRRVTPMDQSGLPLRSGGMRKSDPVSLRMEEIIWGSEGRKVALVATDKVLPALCGVEPLLKKELGDRCNPHDIGTNRAGLIIGELMTHLGYSAAGEAKCPEGGVAKTAMHGPQKTCRKSQGVRARDARSKPEGSRDRRRQSTRVRRKGDNVI